ncbi:uncharacterized protein TERG_00828 [Trichophyton rubrum CBS 118892]|uniref:Uncharacterized protein n=1 Tax=Trichophyton rubrum (strain ATCC MYA-4607 / CBS 118892) TaxID=559305 RepID=F2SDH0_TRIRC|nr:uncharacterized protein TERG_00828 [Trichophyton rubrum CBS 118892]EGD84550.2 hypothetical protein TERG_00828 [Trichophyton rubrum CBS 118892]
MEHRGQDEELAVSVSGLNARRHADKDISLASFTSRYLLNRAHHNLINQHLTQHSGCWIIRDSETKNNNMQPTKAPAGSRASGQPEETPGLPPKSAANFTLALMYKIFPNFQVPNRQVAVFHPFSYNQVLCH